MANDIALTKYSDKLKARAVREYMKLGNLALVARKLDVPFYTMQHWRYRTNWWDELTRRFQEESDRKLAAKMEEVVVKAISQIEERIDTGDKILDSKSGEVISVPVKTRDLTAAVKTLSDRSDILIGRAQKDSIAKEMMSDKLAKLAKEFAAFTQARTIEHDPQEGVPQIEDGFLVLDDDDDSV
jgi:transposase-like protein